MSGLLWEYHDGTKVFYVLGRGVIVVPKIIEGHKLGDSWVFQFVDHIEQRVVKGIERTSAHGQVGLCFGSFSNEEMQDIKSGSVGITKLNLGL